MKCWIVSNGDQWCTLMHAETHGKAIVAAMSSYGGDFIDYSAKRISGLDDKPITYQNAKDADFEYRDDWDCDYLLKPEEFVNDCGCEICVHPIEKGV